MRASVAFVTLLLASACEIAPPPAPPPREMYRDCAVTFTNALGEFETLGAQLKWYARLPGDVHFSLTYFVWLEPKDGEKLKTFGGLADAPDLYVAWHAPRWDKMGPRQGEARSGSVSIRTEYSFQPSGYFKKADVPPLLVAGEDILLVLADRNGQELQRIELPRSYLLAAEAQLRKAEAEFRENLLDKEHRCPLKPVPIIVIT